MIVTEKDTITAEALFEQQEIKDDSEERFRELLLAILLSVQLEAPLRDTKKIIENSKVNVGLKANLSEMIEQQNEIITDEKSTINFNEAIIAGYTFNELIKNRENTTKKQATRFMQIVSDTIKENKSISKTFIQEEVNKYKRSLEAFYRTQTKAGREFGYAKNDKIFSTEVKGWLSVAVLDNKTSPICVRLHNVFYSATDYKTRFDIPYQIPRHPNCRSIYVTVFKDRSIQSYKGQNINTFLNENPKQGEAILGIEKYRLFKEKKIKINNFIDIKGKRFYTNKEIRRRLNIKD